MKFHLGLYFASLCTVFICLSSCSKTENFTSDSIFGEWNLVYNSGGRTMPRIYEKGEIVWTFDDKSLKIDNKKENSFDSNSFSILDTIINNQVERHLMVNNYYAGNIISMQNDSLVLHLEVHIGCGGSKVLVR